MFALLERFNRRPPPSREESERTCQQQLQAEKDAQEKARLTHPELFHGTTSFHDGEDPICLKRDFAKARYRNRIFASHDRIVAAAYAAVVKTHPHTDGCVQYGRQYVPFLVIDDKKSYLENIEGSVKLLLTLPSQSFTPDDYLSGEFFEWISTEPSIDVRHSRRYGSIDEILGEGVQIFFTKSGANHRDVSKILSTTSKDYRAILRGMVRANLLEWENRDRGIAPSRAFF